MLVELQGEGRIVIPPALRMKIGLKDGDLVELQFNPQQGSLSLRRREPTKSEQLAGSFARHAANKKFPCRKQMNEAVAKGLTDSPDA
jgi:bifunctional DNA-binding transcriptional regulator/antitoxin component of YhaV-PrlF toxin-antitoxin module